MEKLVYPVVLKAAKEGGWDVVVPDWDIFTQGKDEAEALYMAKDAMELMGTVYQEDGESFPAPTDIKVVQKEKGINDIVSLVVMDVDMYKRKLSTKSVRRNVSLPSWLDAKAQESGVNVSEVLQQALIQVLES